MFGRGVGVGGRGRGIVRLEQASVNNQKETRKIKKMLKRKGAATIGNGKFVGNLPLEVVSVHWHAQFRRNHSNYNKLLFDQ